MKGPALTAAEYQRLKHIMPRGMTKKQIEAGRTPAGGWTRAQLSEWGVPWPPPKGWAKRLMQQGKATPNTSPSTALANNINHLKPKSFLPHALRFKSQPLYR